MLAMRTPFDSDAIAVWPATDRLPVEHVCLIILDGWGIAPPGLATR